MPKEHLDIGPALRTEAVDCIRDVCVSFYVCLCSCESQSGWYTGAAVLHRTAETDSN